MNIDVVSHERRAQPRRSPARLAPRRVALVAGLGVALLVFAGAGCGHDDLTTGQTTESLTQAQCTYFAVGNKVTICHRTSSARNPYVIIRVNTAGCAAGHVGHAGDYIASSDPTSPVYDPTCNGQGCLPAGAPSDGTIECCAGTAVGGMCPYVAVCGDGIEQAGEACDDGNATDGDGCDRNCTPSACGNGIVTAGEACDDGNTLDGDGCSQNCVIELSCMGLAGDTTVFGAGERDLFLDALSGVTTIDLEHRADDSVPQAGQRFDPDEFVARGIRISVQSADATAHLIWAGNEVGGFGLMLRCAGPFSCNGDIVVEFLSPQRAAGFQYPGNVRAIWKDEQGAVIFDTGDVPGSGDYLFLGLHAARPIKTMVLVRQNVNYIQDLSYAGCFGGT